MKYKVGDKIKVRSDLVAGQTYGGINLLDSMANFRGRIVTITQIQSEAKEGVVIVKFAEDRDRYSYAIEMFETAESIQSDYTIF